MYIILSFVKIAWWWSFYRNMSSWSYNKIIHCCVWLTPETVLSVSDHSHKATNLPSFPHTVYPTFRTPKYINISSSIRGCIESRILTFSFLQVLFSDVTDILYHCLTDLTNVCFKYTPAHYFRDQGVWIWRFMWHARQKREMHIKFWWRNLTVWNAGSRWEDNLIAADNSTALTSFIIL
jgi:hypothetical protein